ICFCFLQDDTSIHRAEPAQVQERSPLSPRYTNLSREELLYELQMCLMDNETLMNQLSKKSPSITELHNQLFAVRKELARSKYVNQVLWRKLDALEAIHGSQQTRAELAIELSQYKDELESTKAKHQRIQDTRSALTQSSRSSSG
ncbi:unnamed protein product, partial [Didymodactylos carnosus]